MSSSILTRTMQSDPIRSMFTTSAKFFVTSSSNPPRDVITTSWTVSKMTSLAAVTTDGGVGNTSRLETTSLGGVDDVERFLEKKNDEFSMLVLPAMVILGLFFVAGVVGNSMVLYVYNRKLQKGTIRWFVQALAIFDLLSCLVAIPGEIIDMRNNYTFGSSPMCKVLRTVSMFCTVSSGMTLMVVAVERYKRICTPLKKQITPRGAQVIITVCTVVASICAAPASVIYGPQTVPTNLPHINGTDCSTADVFLGSLIPLAFSVFQCLLFLLGALGLVGLYSLIGRKVWSHAHFRRMGFNAGVSRRMSIFLTGSECSSPTTDDVVFAFPARKNVVAVTAAAAQEEENSNTSQGANNDNDNNNDDNDNNNVDTKPEKVAVADESLSETERMGNPAVYPEVTASKGKVSDPSQRSNDPDKDNNNDNNNISTKTDKLPSTEESIPETERVGTPPVYPQHSSKPANETSQDEEKPSGTKEPLRGDTPTPPDDLAKRLTRQVSTDPPSTPTDAFPHAMDTFRRPRLSRATSRDRVKSGDSSILRGRYRRRPVQHTQSDMRRFLHRSESVNSGTRRTTLMLFLITLVYLLSFVPYLALMIVKVLDEDSLSGRGGAWELAHNILLRSYFINSMANPIIYSFCSRTFRKESSKVLHCRCCKSSRPRN